MFMHWVVLVGAFFILWFLALQIVLPIGVQSPHETGETVVEGADPGAPLKTNLKMKALIATGIAVVLWGILYTLVLLHILDL
jgi:predicted secreted protein